MQIRLQKHIADLGICSRRVAEKLIQEGAVKINGIIVNKLGTKIDPEIDNVEVLTKYTNKMEQKSNGKNIYIALNKPIDYITSTTSIQGKSIMDLLEAQNQIGRERKTITSRVYPVGRLDKDSEGLILLTNDGDLTNKLTHPRFEHEKEYEITIDTPLSRDARKVLTKGMDIGTESEKEYVQGIEIVKEKNLGRRTIITTVLQEGKNRQLRRMFGRLGYGVISLKRTRISKLQLGTIPTGKWKFIKKQTIL